MDEKNTAKLKKMQIPYIAVRVLLILFAALLFFPDVSPSKIILTSGQAKISSTASLFTNAISYSSLTNGLGRAFDRGWLNEGVFILLFIGCLVVLLGVVLMAVGGCMSVGNLRMKTIGNRFLLGGSGAQLLGVAAITASYFLIAATADTGKITYQFPVGIPVFLVLAVALFALSLILFIQVPRAPKGEKLEMESKYQLFLMLLPFLALVFAFSYLPLYSWRYAFYDYSAGGTISSENFVGLKWFKTLVQNEAYVTRLGTVLKNTLAMSGLGIVTSWVPMVFAIFLTEVRSAKFKRFVQTFTTIPNFISWVLVYAIAFAIFSTDGFINTLLNNITDSTYSTNYLGDSSHMWLKMLAWGMWKGTGWSAIIYISGISGIDQSLYEAATVDGASRFQKMWNITLPMLLPTYVVMLVMSIAGILSNGMDQYLVFTNANNKDIIEVLDLYVYNLGIGNGSIPLSTVVGMAKSIISVALLFINNTTWSIDATNPDSIGERYNYLFWKSYQAAASCEIEQDWRDRFDVSSVEEYMETTDYTVCNEFSFAAKSDDFKTTWSSVTDIIVTYSWRAIYASSDEEFDSIVAEMTQQANAYGYQECVQWSVEQAALRYAADQ